MSDIDQLKITAKNANRTYSDGVLTETALESGDAREIVFGKFVIDPGVSLPAHVHSADTIAYCVTGSCSFRVGDLLDVEFEIGPGEYAFIPAGTVHTEATGENGVELIFARDRQGGESSAVENRD